MSSARTFFAIWLAALASPGAAVPADLDKARAERNLDRRARLAMENAALQLRAASAAEASGDLERMERALNEIGESVDLAYESLQATGRNPRNSRQHKDFETRLRTLLRNLESFRQRLGFEQREQIAPLVEHLEKIHDQVVREILTPGKKK